MEIDFRSLPSRLHLSKRGMEISVISCPVWGLGGETMDHILFKCKLALEVWALVGRWCDVTFPSTTSIK